MSSFKNKNVLITGDASGIGKLMGELIITKDAKSMVVWDINKETLDQTKTGFEKIKASACQKTKIFTFVADVSSLESIIKNSQETKNKVGTIDILINNAGIVVGKYFQNIPTRILTLLWI